MSSKCKQPGCLFNARYKGYCYNHYQNKKYHEKIKNNVKIIGK